MPLRTNLSYTEQMNEVSNQPYGNVSNYYSIAMTGKGERIALNCQVSFFFTMAQKCFESRNLQISLIRIIKSQLFYLSLALFKQVQLYYFLHLLFLKCKQTTQAV